MFLKRYCTVSSLSYSKYVKYHSIRSLSSFQTNENNIKNHILFTNTNEIYNKKSNKELIRALLVFLACQLPYLVKNSIKLLQFSNNIFGKKITNCLLRSTFFGHFCAGENAKDIEIVLDKLNNAGINGILDYAAEADITNDHSASSSIYKSNIKKTDLNGISYEKISARTYDYEDEKTCDLNFQISLQGIKDAAKTKGFTAIKCTALGKPELLQKMSSILNDSYLLFHSLDKENVSKAKESYMNKLIDYSTFYTNLMSKNKENNKIINEKDIINLFNQMDHNNKDGKIDYIDWVSTLNPTDLTMGILTDFMKIEKLNENEINQLNNMIKRLNRLAEKASELKVKLMIDAEQTYLQRAIDYLVLNLQRKYNKNNINNNDPIIYNTFQCYLIDSKDRVLIDLERAKRENFHFACKLVRGAYMIQERKRSKIYKYKDPIFPTIEDTHKNYDTIVEILLDNHKNASFMVASHNEHSVQKTINKMNELNITDKIYFGQLLGMCDYVSYALGKHKYKVYKYLPYGPIQEVIPYLIRRAEENSSMMSGARKEIDLLQKELINRFSFWKN